MHASTVLVLMLNINRIYVRALILIVDLVHLILEELVIIAFLIIDQTNDQENGLHDYALDGAVVGRSAIAILKVDAADAKGDQSCTSCEEVSDCEVVQGLEDQGSVEFTEE